MSRPPPRLSEGPARKGMADRANQVQYTVEWTINPGQVEAFKALGQAAIQAVQANEPDMVGYHWYFDDDQSTCYLHESYANPDGIATHIDHIGPTLMKLLDVSKISRFEVFGDLSPKAQQASRRSRHVRHQVLRPLGRLHQIALRSRRRTRSRGICERARHAEGSGRHQRCCASETALVSQLGAVTGRLALSPTAGADTVTPRPGAPFRCSLPRPGRRWF